jgi:hypothetical protein
LPTPAFPPIESLLAPVSPPANPLESVLGQIPALPSQVSGNDNDQPALVSDASALR